MTYKFGQYFLQLPMMFLFSEIIRGKSDTFHQMNASTVHNRRLAPDGALSFCSSLNVSTAGARHRKLHCEPRRPETLLREEKWMTVPCGGLACSTSVPDERRTPPPRDFEERSNSRCFSIAVPIERPRVQTKMRVSCVCMSTPE